MRLQISKGKKNETLYIVKSIYINGKSSNKVVERLGTVQEIREKIGTDKDPYEWGKQRAAYLTTLEQQDPSEHLRVELSSSKQIRKNRYHQCNIGYLFLQSIFYELRIPEIMRDLQRNYSLRPDPCTVLEKLVYFHILNPVTSQDPWKVQNYIESFEFTLTDAEDLLDVLSAEWKNILSELADRADETGYAYFSYSFLREYSIQSTELRMKTISHLDKSFPSSRLEGDSLSSLLDADQRLNASIVISFVTFHISHILLDRTRSFIPGVTYEEILDTLREMQVIRVCDKYIPIYQRTDMTDALHAAFGFRTDFELLSKEKISEILRKVKEGK